MVHFPLIVGAQKFQSFKDFCRIYFIKKYRNAKILFFKQFLQGVFNEPKYSDRTSCRCHINTNIIVYNA